MVRHSETELMLSSLASRDVCIYRLAEQTTSFGLAGHDVSLTLLRLSLFQERWQGLSGSVESGLPHYCNPSFIPSHLFMYI
jgi:hypothetical protein